MIELLFLGGAAFAGGAHAVRKTRTERGRDGGGYGRGRHGRGSARRPPRTESLLVKAWKSAGAPHTDETMLADAVADLGGRVIGKGARGAARCTRATKPWAQARWQRREAAGGTASFIRRPRRATGSAGGSGPGGSAGGGPGGAAGGGRRVIPGRVVNPTPSPGPASGGGAGAGRGGARPMPAGRAAPPLPAPRPAGPAPSPAGRAPSPWQRSAAARSDSAGTPSRAGRSGSRSPARRAGRGRNGRARPRMRITGPLHLQVPGTDAEFLDACHELQQILRGIGVAVEEWTDDVATRRVPPIVTGPLYGVNEGLVDAAACTALASQLFEAWFAEARAVADAGIEFTGDDSA